MKKSRTFRFAFHADRPKTFYKDVEEQTCKFAELMRKPELRAHLLSCLPFATKKAVSLTCKENMYLISDLFEVWDTNKVDFMRHDRGKVVVGVKADGSLYYNNVSWARFQRYKHKLTFEAYVPRLERCYFPNSTPLPIEDPMMVPLESLDPTSYEHPDPKGAEKYVRPQGAHLVIMFTAVRFDATEATKSMSPSTSYTGQFESMCRGFEAIFNVGQAIVSLDLSSQPLLTARFVDLIMPYLPNCRLITLRDNAMLAITDIFGLMSAVAASRKTRPGSVKCQLDFYPYFHHGPPVEDETRPEDERWGSFGIAFEDYGIHTHSVIATLVERVMEYQRALDMDVLGPDMGLRLYLGRLPLSPSFVDRLLESHQILDEHRGKKTFAAEEMRHHRRVYDIAFDEPGETGGRPIAKDLVQCGTCGIRVWKQMKHGRSCTCCTFGVYSRGQWHRYQQEKLDILDRFLGGKEEEKPKNLPTLFSLFGHAPPRDPEARPYGNASIMFRPRSLHENRYVIAYKDFIQLEVLRRRDLWRQAEPEASGWVPTTKMVTDMRESGWKDRGPGDHEFFPPQRQNMFDQGRLCGMYAFNGTLTQARPLEWEAGMSNYKLYRRAKCLDKMKKIQSIAPEKRQRFIDQFNFW